MSSQEGRVESTKLRIIQKAERAWETVAQCCKSSLATLRRVEVGCLIEREEIAQRGLPNREVADLGEATQ
ncbi:hypothetical protein [Mesorhizobium sp. M0478]|uniref:hypothetical protein n=1 Tax=Mesorhizobium sp. M0478 TaxID=2956947 RepID=UPI00333E1306